jgi:hypothetical protein
MQITPASGCLDHLRTQIRAGDVLLSEHAEPQQSVVMEYVTGVPNALVFSMANV